MDKLIICTTGTSIAKVRAPIELNKANWAENDVNFVNQLNTWLDKQDLKIEKVRREISAEMNVIDRMEIGGNDRIILLVSDTAAGRICAEILKKVIFKVYDLAEANVEIKRVEGLQVFNAKLMRENGLKNLVKTMFFYLTSEEFKNRYEIIFNATGGFKVVIPFVTVLGMLYGKRSVYLFENSNELIYLPPLPFSFDLEMYARVRPALDLLDREIAVPESEFLNKVIGYTSAERDLFMAYTEPYGQNVTISPLAFCLLQTEENASPVLVSKEVSKFLADCPDEIGKLAVKRILKFLSNPIWRAAHIETWPNKDFLVIKKKRDAVRLVGYMRNDEFHVGLVFTDHDEYLKRLAVTKKSDLERMEFIRWENKEELGVDEERRDDLAVERDTLLVENKKLVEINNEYIRKNKMLDSEKEMMALEAEELKGNCQALSEKMGDLSRRLQEAQGEKEKMETSFIGRLFYLFKRKK